MPKVPGLRVSHRQCSESEVRIPRRRLVLAVPKGLLVLPALAVGARPLAAWGAAQAGEAAKISAAKKEGQVVWYVSMFDIGTAEQVAKSFQVKYPGLSVQVVRATAGVIYQRVLQETQAGVFACDVFSSTDQGQYMSLADKKLLRPYLPAGEGGIRKRFQNIDPQNHYQVASVGLMLIIYNTQKVPQTQAPSSWTDLLDPKWKNRIAMGHPAFSGYVATWVLALTELYGWNYFERLAKQNPLIGRSANDAITQLNSAERVVAAGPDATTLKSKHRGNPVDILYPSDGSVLMTAPSAIMAKAQHPNAAELFMDYFMTKPYSQILAQNGFMPLQSDVAAPKGMRPLEQVKTIRPPAEKLKTGIPEVIQQFRATFGV